MSRIRHATETFVNQMIDAVKKLIESNTEQINDLFGETIEIGFGKRCKPTTVSSYKDLPNGRWFGTIPDAPVEGVCYYDVYLGDNQVYKRVECKSWLSGTIYFNQNINGAWGEWKQLATTSKTDILCTPKAGVTIVEQKSYMVNNVVYISIMFKKTDNSAINSIFSAINVPSFARPLMEISLSVAAVDAVGNGIVNKSISCPLNTSGDIWVVSDTESVATQIRVNGVFVL